LRVIGFSSSVFLFVWSLWLWVVFDEYVGTFQFLIFVFKTPFFGIDGLSLIFIILTTFLFVCCFLLVWSVKTQLKLLLFLLLFLELLLLLVFSVVDFFFFLYYF